MDRIEFLVEEPSMAEVLKSLLPKILPAPWVLNENYFDRAHNGKSDLLRSIPNKLKGFGTFIDQLTGFVIVQDQDSNDCRLLKQELVALCSRHVAANERFLIRIACHELESWYIGDEKALQAVFPRHRINPKAARFREPDACINPKNELKKMFGAYSQIAVAREIGKHIEIEANRSESFQQFVTGVRRFAQS